MLFWWLGRLRIGPLLAVDFAVIGVGFALIAASASPTAYPWGAGVQQIGLGGLVAAFSMLALVSLAAAGVAPSSGLFARVRTLQALRPVVAIHAVHACMLR